MSFLNFRHLKPNEVDVFPKMVKEKGCLVLLYKDARCDMNILDETVGPLGWKRQHLRENANCIVSIYDSNNNHWVSKEDTGTESNQDKAKGLASDSFKRSCFNWGIGRELYTSPFTWIVLDKGETYQTTVNGKPKWNIDNKLKFHVSVLEVSDTREITKLEIQDQNDKVRFTWPKKSGGGKKNTSSKTNTNNNKKPSQDKKETPTTNDDPVIDNVKYATLIAKMAEAKVTNAQMNSAYKVSDVKELKVSQYIKAMKKLEATIEKHKTE